MVTNIDVSYAGCEKAIKDCNYTVIDVSFNFLKINKTKTEKLIFNKTQKIPYTPGNCIICYYDLNNVEMTLTMNRGILVFYVALGTSSFILPSMLFVVCVKLIILVTKTKVKLKDSNSIKS